MLDLRPHPGLLFFPLHTDAEYAELRDRIEREGQLVACVRQGNTLIDGRARIRACLELGIKPKIIELDGSGFDLVMSLNFHRRHMSETMRALVAGRFANLKRGQMARSGHSSPTRKQAAHVADVTLSAVKAAKVVDTKGVPELVQAVEREDIALTTAAEIARHPPAKQREILEKTARASKAKGYALALAREKQPRATSLELRLTPPELVGLRALRDVGAASSVAAARAGVQVLKRIVPAVRA